VWAFFVSLLGGCRLARSQRLTPLHARIRRFSAFHVATLWPGAPKFFGGHPRMDTTAAVRSLAAIECCPPLEPCNVCDVLEFPYRLPFRATVSVGDQRQVVPVEVTL